MVKTKTESTKSLDRRLAKILAGANKPTDFIIADAKDADISVGVMAPARKLEHLGRVFTDRGGIFYSNSLWISFKCGGA